MEGRVAEVKVRVDDREWVAIPPEVFHRFVESDKTVDDLKREVMRLRSELKECD